MTRWARVAVFDARGQVRDNEDLAFTCGGDAAWFAQSTEYNYSGDAAQSGAIDDDEETWLEATVEGPGTVYFDRKLSCGPNGWQNGRRASVMECYPDQGMPYLCTASRWRQRGA
jgi:hypothetical protein